MDIEKLKAVALALPNADWGAELTEENEPAAPNIYRVYDIRDSSYEATVCEMWSGEHDNAALAAYIAAFNPSVALELIAEIERLRKQGDEDLETIACLDDRLLELEHRILDGPSNADQGKDQS